MDKALPRASSNPKSIHSFSTPPPSRSSSSPSDAPPPAGPRQPDHRTPAPGRRPPRSFRPPRTGPRAAAELRPRQAGAQLPVCRGRSWLRCSGQPRAVLPLCSPHPLCSSCPPLDLQQRHPLCCSQGSTVSVVAVRSTSAGSCRQPSLLFHVPSIFVCFNPMQNVPSYPPVYIKSTYAQQMFNILPL